MRNFRLLIVLLVLMACGSAYAADAPPSHSIPPLPSTALGAEPVGHAPDPAAPPMISGTPSKPQSLDYPRVLAALGIVIGLIFVLRWFGRFFFPATGGRGKSRAVEVISRSPLSPKQQVMLLRVGRRLIVVGDSGSQMNPLCEITDPDEVAALVGQLQGERSSTPARAFGSMFGRSRQVFEAEDDGRPPPSEGLREPEEQDPPVATAREELSGLRERVRLLAEQFKGDAR